MDRLSLFNSAQDTSILISMSGAREGGELGDMNSGGSWLMEVKLDIKILTCFLDKKILGPYS